MERFVTDLRFAVRTLARRPGFSVIAILTLALGIGVNSAVFSILHGVMFRPLPYREPADLLAIGRTLPQIAGAFLPISVPNFIDLDERAQTVDIMATADASFMAAAGDGGAERKSALRVTHEFFDLLGVPLALGRGFSAVDDMAGTEPVVVVSNAYWREQLSADPGATGSVVYLDEDPYTVIGVAAPDFQFRSEDLWVPMQWDGNDTSPGRRGSNFLRIYGRLHPGTTVEAAAAELSGVWRQIGAEYSDNYDDSDMTAMKLADYWIRRTRTALWLLAGAAGFVLVIACANVANLILARTESRTREIAVRAAMGASRGSIVGQFVTESVVVSVAGGLVGILAAFLGVQAILGAFGGSVPRSDEVHLNATVLLFSLGVSLVTGILVGLVPALLARPDVNALKEGGRGGSAKITALRKSLVVTEVALSLVLITGAGLLLKSFARAANADLGFNTENLIAANVWLPPSRYQEDAAVVGFFRELQDALEANNNITRVGMTNLVPVRNFGWNVTTLTAVGRPDIEGSFVEVRRVSPDYFSAMGVPIVSGRDFTDSDPTPGNEPDNKTIINEDLARRLFPDIDPLGQRLDFGRDGLEIIGVVGNIKTFGPDREMRPVFYLPSPVADNVIIRATAGPEIVVPILREAVSRIDPAVPVYRVETLEAIVDRSLGSRKFQLILLGIFAVVALVLGAIGIYGVMSYTVAQRTREIGVRLALGQGTNSVLRLVVLQGTRLALLGVVIGTAGAIAMRRVIASSLYDVNAGDPVTYAGVAVLLTLVAAFACFVPGWRASKVDPMEALRYE